MNQKGFTTVEVLMCFVIVSIVMMSLFSTISAFNEKKNIESDRAKIYEFKNSLTYTIQKDIIKSGLTFASISREGETTGDSVGITYILKMTFKDNNTKVLRVHQRFTKTPYRVNGTSNQDDEFYIEYGPENDTIFYNLPHLGETKGTYVSNTYIPMDDNGNCFTGIDRIATTECRTAQNLQINNVLMSITNESDLSSETHVLNVYIGFYHPDLGTKYAINIVAPIDYKQGSVDVSNAFPYSAPNSPDGIDPTKIYYPDISTYKN